MTEKSNLLMSASQRQKKCKSDAIIENAIEMFCERGIENVKVEEIAHAANVGTATVYRYFSTKANLAVRCAVFVWENESQKYMWEVTNNSYNELNGYEQVKKIMDILIRIFEKNPRFFKFLKEFDAYVLATNVTDENMIEYENAILSFKPYFTKALEKGIEDDSIRLKNTPEEAYFAIMHAVLSLMQKLSSDGEILESDKLVNKSFQVKIVIDLILLGLKAQR